MRDAAKEAKDKLKVFKQDHDEQADATKQAQLGVLMETKDKELDAGLQKLLKEREEDLPEVL